MAYTLQKLNVVKVVERAEQRDALLAKGFVEVKKATAGGKDKKDNPPADDA